MKKILIATLCFVCLILFTHNKNPKNKLNHRKISSVDKPIGQIIKFKGTVFINNKIVKSLKKVFAKDIIKTKSKSFVKIKYNDDSIFVASSNTKFEVLEFKMKNKNNRTFSTFLEIGKLKTEFLHKNNSGNLNVSTKTASMGVRGTEFLTEVNKKSTNVFLLEGKIDLKINDKILKVSPNEYVKVNNNFEYKKDTFDGNDLINVFEDELLDFYKQNKNINNQKDKTNSNKVTVNKSEKNINNQKDKINSNKVTVNKSEKNINKNNLKSNSKSPALKRTLSDSNKNNFRSPSSIMPVDSSTDLKEKYKGKEITSKNIPKLINDMNDFNLTPRQKANVAKEILSEENLISYRKKIAEKYEIADYEKIDKIKEEIQELSIKEFKVLQKIISEGKALPLRENDEILFFERYPETLKVLPKDSEGNTIAIDLVDNEIKRDIPVTYDDNGNPIDTIVDDNGNPISVPVIDGYGEIKYVPIEKDGKVVVLPKIDSGDEPGVPINEETNTVDINSLETLDKTRNKLWGSHLLFDTLNIFLKNTIYHTNETN